MWEGGGTGEDLRMGGMEASVRGAGKKQEEAEREREKLVDVLGDGTVDTGAAVIPGAVDEDAALGVYEAHTDVFHCEFAWGITWTFLPLTLLSCSDRQDTQPTTARLEYLMNEPVVAGGARVGSNAWGVLWVQSVMEVPTEVVE